MSFDATPLDGSTPAIPMSSAISPGDRVPRPIMGGPEVTDGQGNILTPIAQYTYIGTALAPYGANPAQTAAAGADTLYKFGTGGTTPFGHVAGQNNTTQNVYIAFDQSTTSAGNQVYTIASGQFFSFDRKGTILHFSSPSQQTFGGIGGITVEAFA